MFFQKWLCAQEARVAATLLLLLKVEFCREIARFLQNGFIKNTFFCHSLLNLQPFIMS
jgi:hypothetical protein